MFNQLEVPKVLQELEHQQEKKSDSGAQGLLANLKKWPFCCNWCNLQICFICWNWQFCSNFSNCGKSVNFCQQWNHLMNLQFCQKQQNWQIWQTSKIANFANFDGFWLLLQIHEKWANLPAVPELLPHSEQCQVSPWVAPAQHTWFVGGAAASLCFFDNNWAWFLAVLHFNFSQPCLISFPRGIQNTSHPKRQMFA